MINHRLIIVSHALVTYL